MRKIKKKMKGAEMFDVKMVWNKDLDKHSDQVHNSELLRRANEIIAELKNKPYDLSSSQSD